MPPSYQAIQQSLSSPRLGTYLNEVTLSASPTLPPPAAALAAAVKLYGWNAAVSAAFLHPLHICEVTLRNAISGALERLYGPNWPSDMGFTMSLPIQAGAFSPRNELQSTWNRVFHSSKPTVGHLIAELKFAFWEHLLTARYQSTIWDSQCKLAFPHQPAGSSKNQVRSQLKSDVLQIRKLRNRIAHHEPIFARSLDDDLSALDRIVRLICPDTCEWMQSGQMVRFMLGHRPS